MQSSLQPGMTLCGKYKILQKIGKGGMAFVFKAYSIEHDVECALKEMQDQYLDPESKDKITAQFMNEATTLKKLDHPGVPYVLETFESEGKHYLAMEYVAGDTLEDFVVNSPALLTLDQVLGLVWQITDILKYLHNLPEPVILRDLKPSNIMLNKDGKIKIIDFGIAKVFEQGNASRTMAKIKGSGSSGFAPPEQYGAGGTDKRSDIYAFGVTIYYLLTGQILPDSVDRILSGGKLEPVKDVNPTAGNEIQAMIEKMVQLKPADRFQNVEEVIEYLNNHGMNGEYPLLKPYSSSVNTVEADNEDDEESISTNFGRRQDDDEEEEEDTRIFLPRQIYTKRTQPVIQNEEEEAKEEESKEESFRKSDIKSRFDASNMPLQTEKLLGSGAIADGIKSDGSLRKIEEVGKEPTRKLDKSDLEKYLKLQKTNVASNKKEEVKPKEVKEKKPVNWGCVVLLSLFMILLIAIIYAFIALKDINPFIPTKEKNKKEQEEKITVKVETPKPVETKPVVTFVEETLKGKISAVEKVGNSKSLILKSYLDSRYVKLKPGKTPLPEGLKVGSEVCVTYKIPKTNPQQPFEILEIKLTNPPKPKAKPSSSGSSTGSSGYTPPRSSGYSSGSSNYTPPSRSSGSSSGYSSGSSSYTPPSRSSSSSSGYSSGSSSYTPPSRSSGTSSSYSSGSSSSSTSTSESGGFTQKRATDY